MEKKFKEFKPTSWAIENKLSIYVLVFIIAIFGLFNYNTIPKEQFPEIVIPTIVVNTIYPGAAPADIENLVTRPIEKNIKGINGVKKVTSRSVQDFSSIVVEFNTGVVVAEAKQKVKDAVDKSKRDLPTNLDQDPSVQEVDFSEFPIMYLNMSGDLPLDVIKKHADDLQEKIEGLSEITRVDIVGALDREIQIDIDMYKMQAASLTFSEVENAIKYDNMTVSGGNIDLQGMSRSVRVIGEFKTLDDVKNIIVNTASGAKVKLKDLAVVHDGFKEQESFARFDGKNVITLNVVKKSGQNLLDASDKIKDIIKELKTNKFPDELKVEISGDQSKYTRTTLTDLNNTIIIGFILVVIVLMFFMGIMNSLFVGLSIPLSMALAYIIMPYIGFTMNMLVMFAFLFALGIVVDDAIVVIENTHRVFMKKQMDIATAAKFAAGEVFAPILSGTLTTLAPFFPLAFWPGVVGKFMYFIPVTLIITLFASLLVAYLINPVFAIDFMKHDEEERPTPLKKLYYICAGIAVVAIPFYLNNLNAIANLLIFVSISIFLHNIYGYKVLRKFQHHFIPAMMRRYEALLVYVLHGRRPYWLFSGMVGLFFITMVITNFFPLKVVFFPENEPNNVITYIKMPIGTQIAVTDSVAKLVEQKIKHVIGDDNKVVESIITNVAFGASEDQFDNSTKVSHLAKVSVNFVEFQKRLGINTSDYLTKIRDVVKDIPGAEIVVDKNKNGPPVGKPINIELASEDLDLLVETSSKLKRYLDSLSIDGVEELKSDFAASKPELLITLDRERANLEGISAGMVGGQIRTALLGSEISKFREGEDQYPIMLRFSEYQRKDVEQLINLSITYRDMNSGTLRQIPLSAVAKVEYRNSYGQINRLNLKRVITLTSNVLDGYTANEINAQIKKAIPNFSKSTAVEIRMTGEQEDQAETVAFLSKAMLFALFLILFILINQFGSFSKMAIILLEVVFSIIGVLLGYVFFGMTVSVIMTGLGIVALAGIVVRNGILLVEFTDVLKDQGMKTRAAIIEAGKTRIIPVILTAAATVLGLIPLAVGFNIDFVGLFSSFQPHIHFGGDNVKFFGLLAWTIIFGLTFATFLTLVLIPSMYFMIYVREVKAKRRSWARKFKKNK
ncbi:efflux RND transporter permease subunit [Williamwhitmania taraxaci]|uniref:Multidrug efflux pump subunit AcrB n=1 Tax=Williamwhitmania taraxaci TaxID=1640674 RepID=A0A1G6GXD1_9BACT|nr:efflux RND transporter permease subunit [Williamwhitmania taraxaci]SDB86594.1 Multidrug efflux pump subunit AcrB [Williamwhitmania taraxaci]